MVEILVLEYVLHLSPGEQRTRLADVVAEANQKVMSEVFIRAVRGRLGTSNVSLTSHLSVVFSTDETHQTEPLAGTEAFANFVAPGIGTGQSTPVFVAGMLVALFLGIYMVHRWAKSPLAGRFPDAGCDPAAEVSKDRDPDIEDVGTTSSMRPTFECRTVGRS